MHKIIVKLYFIENDLHESFALILIVLKNFHKTTITTPSTLPFWIIIAGSKYHWYIHVFMSKTVPDANHTTIVI